MKIVHLIKLVLVLFAFSGFVACSSSSEEVIPEEVVETNESDVDATARRAQELEDEARRRAAAAEERMMRSALATKVFYFDFDVAEFRSADRDVLTYHARDLAANPSKQIRLEGHADERGTPEYNIALGERRGQAVAKYLQSLGVAESQISVVSYGEEKPMVKTRTEDAFAKNRRAVLVY